jgi:hypothetical protein
MVVMAVLRPGHPLLGGQRWMSGAPWARPTVAIDQVDEFRAKHQIGCQH